MAMSSGSGGGMLAEINVTPMVDVMLVLLIIFMVAAPMIQNGVDVQLPQARGQVMQNDEGKLILTVTKEQQVYLGKAQIATCPGRLPQDELAIGRCMDGVMTKLQTNEKLQADHELYLHADETLPYGIVVKVMAAAKAAGAEKLGMITDPLQ